MKLYTKTICPKCLWVKSELSQVGLEAEFINIDHDQQAMLKITAAGFSSVPILEVNGEFIGDVPTILNRIEQFAQ